MTQIVSRTILSIIKSTTHGEQTIMPTTKTQSETDFLKAYDASQYERPSVTADIVTFTITENNKLALLLIKRGEHPYKDHWALPGGFLIANKESVDQTARRELHEETGIDNGYLKQLATFSSPDRDPRTHVISVAYTALIPKSKLSFQAGDDASDALLFEIDYDVTGLRLTHDKIILYQNNLAFDHAKIIKTAILRLRNRIDYEPDAFELLENKSMFTIFELKQIFDAIKNTKLNNANFRKTFTRNYVNKGFVQELNITKPGKGHKPATCYKYSL